MLFPIFGIENGPENQIIPSCLAELRHSAAAKSDNLNKTKTPHLRGFCFPAIRQGYSRDALHQYPCHIAECQYFGSFAWGPRKLSFLLQLMLSSPLFMTHNELKKEGDKICRFQH